MEKTVFDNEKIVFKEINIDNQAFWLQDLYGYGHDIFDRVIHCKNIYIPKRERRQGKATRLLQSYIEENVGDDNLYFIQAGVNTIEYTEKEFEEFKEDDFNELFGKLRNFLNKNGFVNINTFIGTYNFKEVYVYINEAAAKLFEVIATSYENKTFITEFEDDLLSKTLIYEGTNKIDEALHDKRKQIDIFFDVEFVNNIHLGIDIPIADYYDYIFEVFRKDGNKTICKQIYFKMRD